MPMRKHTLRKLPPLTRKVARLIAEMESTTTKAKNLLLAIEIQEWIVIQVRREDAAGIERTRAALATNPKNADLFTP